MSFLIVTIPVSLLLAGVLLALVIHAVRSGALDDWEGPAQRLLHDDDSAPELGGRLESCLRAASRRRAESPS